MTSSDDPIEAMQNKILKDAEQKAQEIISEAKKEANEMIKQVQVEMEQLEETENEAIQERVEESKRKKTAETKTEYLRHIQGYKKEITESVFNETLNRLKKYTQTKRYPKKLKRLIIEAGISIGGGDLVVLLNNEDKKSVNQEFLNEAAEKIAENTSTKTHLKLSKEDINSLGGVKISKVGESATVDNTFEERLNRKRKEISGELENILFR